MTWKLTDGELQILRLCRRSELKVAMPGVLPCRSQRGRSEALLYQDSEFVLLGLFRRMLSSRPIGCSSSGISCNDRCLAAIGIFYAVIGIHDSTFAYVEGNRWISHNHASFQEPLEKSSQSGQLLSPRGGRKRMLFEILPNNLGIYV